MAQTVVTYEKCPQCNGTTFFSVASGSGGSGQLDCHWTGCVDGYIEKEKTTYDPGLDDLMDRCDDVMDKLGDIEVKVDEIKVIVDAL